MEAPKMRYSDEELAEFKVLVEQKLNDTRQELEDLKQSLQNTSDQINVLSSKGVEDANDFSEREYLLTMITRHKKLMMSLEKAMARIANRTYGICVATGKLIDKRRLMAVPHTTMSIEAKNSRRPETQRAPVQDMSSRDDNDD